jgi:hypothetical protein
MKEKSEVRKKIPTPDCYEGGEFRTAQIRNELVTQNHAVWRKDNSKEMQRQEGGGKFFELCAYQFRFALLLIGIIFAITKTDLLE